VFFFLFFFFLGGGGGGGGGSKISVFFFFFLFGGGGGGGGRGDKRIPIISSVLHLAQCCSITSFHAQHKENPAGNAVEVSQNSNCAQVTGPLSCSLWNWLNFGYFTSATFVPF